MTTNTEILHLTEYMMLMSRCFILLGGGGLFTTLVCATLEGGYADVCVNVTVVAVYAYVCRSGPGRMGAMSLFQIPCFQAISLYFKLSLF